MTNSYSGDPATGPVDAVRFLARDNGPTTFYVSDEEIEWFLSEENNNIYSVASKVAYQVGTQFVKTSGGSKSVGGLSLGGGETKARDYFNLAKSLEARAMRGSFVPTAWAGGVNKSDKETVDDTALSPSFTRGVHDNPGGPAEDQSARLNDTRRME